VDNNLLHIVVGGATAALNPTTTLMSQADPHFDLLSAYLDREATPDEVARVENLLRDGQKQEVLEEMRALREGVQALPNRQLGPEFTARVIAEIQRREGAETSVGLRQHAEVQANAHSPHRLSKSARRAVWAAAAVAAVVVVAVALSLFAPRQQPPALVHEESGSRPDSEVLSVRDEPRDDGEVRSQQDPEPQAVDTDDAGDERGSPAAKPQQPVRPAVPKVVGTEVPPAPKPVRPTAEPPLEGLVNVAPGAIQALLFVELAISEEGTKEKAFEELLGRHKVELSEDWAIPGGVERVLLKLPCVDGAEAFVVENQQEASGGHPVDLVYSVILGAEVNRLQADIQRLPTGIVGYDFGIGIRPKELANNRFVERRRALVEAGKVERFFGEAKQIALSGLLFSPLNTGRSVFTKLEGPALKPPRDNLPVETGADQAFELLFVIHRVP